MTQDGKPQSRHPMWDPIDDEFIPPSSKPVRPAPGVYASLTDEDLAAIETPQQMVNAFGRGVPLVSLFKTPLFQKIRAKNAEEQRLARPLMKVGEWGLAWWRHQPTHQRRLIDPQYHRIVQRLAHAVGHRGVVAHQPDPVHPVLVFAQGFAQLALQKQALLAIRRTSACAHAHQQPLPLESGQGARHTIQPLAQQRIHRAYRVNQLAKTGTALRTHHEIGKVRGHHRQ